MYYIKNIYDIFMLLIVTQYHFCFHIFTYMRLFLVNIHMYVRDMKHKTVLYVTRDTRDLEYKILEIISQSFS